MKLETLRDLYVEQLHDLYSAETQLVEALPKMAKAASTPQLQNAFQEHLTQTKIHVQRIVHDEDSAPHDFARLADTLQAPAA